jgi:glucosamine kinase
MDSAEKVTPCFLGLDGGGTRTRAVIVDSGGREIGRGLSGSSNAQVVGVETAVGHIYAAVAQACAARVALPLTAAWCGISGVDRPADYATLTPHLVDLAATVELTNDAELGLAALPGACGVCLIAGTGSIAVGRDPTGRHARAGGWGYLLGDEGSGYDLGLRALQAIARAADGRGPATTLTGLVLRAWELATPSDLIGAVYGYGATASASIAPLAGTVFAAAADGDGIAQGIVAEAAGQLADTVLAVAGQLAFTGPIPLALVGGVLVHQPAYGAAISARIQDVRPAAPVVVPDPALAAAQALAAAA